MRPARSRESLSPFLQPLRIFGTLPLSAVMIKAFLFDFDGVIADTEVPTFESWRRVFADYGVELTVADWLPAVGSGSSTSGAFDAVAHLERLLARRVDRAD